LVNSVSGVPSALMNSTATIEPRPRTSAIVGACSRSDSSFAFSLLPSCSARSHSRSSSITSSTACADAIASAFAA
jgi:hypothetical protein